MKIVIKEIKDLTNQDKMAFDELENKAFGKDDGGIEWAAMSDWHVFVWLDNLLVGHVEFTVRSITVNSAFLQVGCIGGVCSDLSMRGKGFAKAALIEAHKYLFEKLNVSYCVLLTGDMIAPFYQKLGYKIINAPCVMKQKSGNVFFKDVVMALSDNEKAWPNGTIDLCGLPW
jgi:predicted N-acetyltransferase YhbS